MDGCAQCWHTQFAVHSFKKKMHDVHMIICCNFFTATDNYDSAEHEVERIMHKSTPVLVLSLRFFFLFCWKTPILTKPEGIWTGNPRLSHTSTC